MSPWLLCFGAYIWPWLKSMDRVEAQRAIATLHSFRFFGLVFIVPGVVGPDLPADFATVRRLWRFRNRRAGHAGASRRSGYVRCSGCSSSPSISWASADSSSTITTRSGRPSGAGRGAGRHLRDPDHLRAAADDHARRRALFAGASATDGGAGTHRCGRFITPHRKSAWACRIEAVAFVLGPTVQQGD